MLNLFFGKQRLVSTEPTAVGSVEGIIAMPSASGVITRLASASPDGIVVTPSVSGVITRQAAASPDGVFVVPSATATVGSGGDVLVIHDTFTGANGTDMNNRAPDTVNTPGNSWFEYNSRNFEIQSNRCAVASSGLADNYLLYNTGISDNFRIEATICLPTVSSFNTQVGVSFRGQGTSNTLGAKIYGNQLDIINTGSSASFTPVAGTEYAMKVVVSGDLIQVYIDDVLIDDVTTSTNNTQVYMGVYGVWATGATAPYIADFKLYST